MILGVLLQACKQDFSQGKGSRSPLALRMLLFLLSLLRVPYVAHCSPDSWTIYYYVSLCITL